MLLKPKEKSGSTPFYTHFPPKICIINIVNPSRFVRPHPQRCTEDGFPQTCYGMSKAFLIAYTRLLAREGVTAFACCPGLRKSVVLQRLVYVRITTVMACPYTLSVSPEPCVTGYCKTDMTSNRGPRSGDKGAETPLWLAVSGPGPLQTRLFMTRPHLLAYPTSNLPQMLVFVTHRHSFVHASSSPRTRATAAPAIDETSSDRRHVL